jgi:hypothetical protein
MIELREINTNLVKMKIQMTIPQGDIFNFLQQRGYEVKSWLWTFTDETFPNGITTHQSWTFTATKPAEPQSENTLYMAVFEREMKTILKDFKIGYGKP